MAALLYEPYFVVLKDSYVEHTLTHTHLFLGSKGSKGRESTSCEEMITVLSWLGVVFNAYLAIRLSIQSR